MNTKTALICAVAIAVGLLSCWSGGDPIAIVNYNFEASPGPEGLNIAARPLIGRPAFLALLGAGLLCWVLVRGRGNSRPESLRYEGGQRMPNKIVRIFSAVACCVVCGCAHAGPITWGTVTNETGNASDVITTGTFIGSALTNPLSTTVNGVTFDGLATLGGGTETFANGSDIVVTGISCYECPFGSPPAGWPSNYQTLVRGESFAGSNATVDILLEDLTPGDNYEIEIFEAYWNNNWATSFSDGVNSSGPLNVGEVGSDTGQYVTGTFTAGSATEDIHVNSATSYDIVDAIQLRDLTEPAPEPGTMLLFTTGASLIAWSRRRGSKKAILKEAA